MRMFSVQLNCWLTFEQYEAICKNLPESKQEEKTCWFGGWPIYQYQNDDEEMVRFLMEY